MPLVYRDGRVRTGTHAALARLRWRAAAPESERHADAALSLLIDVAEFESAVVDVLCPDRDERDPLVDKLRELTCEAARAWVGISDGHGRKADLSQLQDRLESLPEAGLPRAIDIPVSEGYAYYAVFPETYVASARRFLERERPARVCAIGVRSIGTSLSAVVAAAIDTRGCDTSTLTVRPQGPPLAREVRLGGALLERLLDEARRNATFAIVDQGPGISGSSFASVFHALTRLGIDPGSIFLFPSWLPSSSALKSSDAATVWDAQQKYSTAVPEIGLTPARVFGLTDAAIDFSGGEWRRTVIGDGAEWPVVQPQHEQMKAYIPSSERILKFVGLGRYGEDALTRAQVLADARLGPDPGELRRGFLDLPFVAGTPLRRCGGIQTAATIGTHIGRVDALFSTKEAADMDPLFMMVESNSAELLHAPPPPAPKGRLRAVKLDGRMLPHEWLRACDGRLVKLDGLAHHQDHFLPGIQASAWDLAGAIVEFRMNGPEEAALVDAFERASGDRATRPHLRYYRGAYSLFRAGYSVMAEESLRGTPDGHRFERSARAYSQCALNAIACGS